MFALSAVFLFCVLRRTLKTHAALFGADVNMFMRKKRNKGGILRSLTVLQVLWEVMALSGAALTVLLKYFPEYWLINGLLAIVLTVLSIRIFDELYGIIYENKG